MPRQPVQTLKGISPNVLPSIPDDAEILEHRRDGSVLARVTETTRRKVPATDEDGEHRTREVEGPAGSSKTKLFHIEEEEVEREILFEPRKTGRVVKNYDWQPDPAEEARRERRRQVEEFQETLAERAVERGLTPSELVDALLGEDEPDAAAEQVTAEPETPEDYALEMVRPGKWSMPDGTVWPAEGSATKLEAIEHLGETFDRDLALAYAEDLEG